ncbi:hypothetical protein DP122_05185 [Clostridium tetani]|uniref:HipA family kinase n=1 Tax=Clostridium tetani TaxID=1513 RepID=UPI00100B9535|nr:HipA family kinase [Clostridium tetani]RXI55296.1 hypothetical protein DP122_05185 [Clostridium tetani]RXM75138.1 hypothetical protein DP154_10240 [Clostridium tetani]RYU98483.1 hypothetical protein DP144_10685 [Clostridium tetani]
MLHIDELKYPIGNGATNPIMGVAENKYYVVKTFNNIEGNKVLINELVSHYIAKKLELPIPKAQVCLVDKNTIIDKNVSDMEDFTEECYGIGFCSEYIEKSTVISSPKMIKLTNNYKWLIPKLMLFDHIVYNKDRNKGNLLLTTDKKEKKLMLIDHSHVFNLETIWDSITLKQKIEEKDYDDIHIMENNAYLYSMFKNACKTDLLTINENINYFKKMLTIDFFKKVIEYIPEVWENNIIELESLSEYLIYRFNNIDKYGDLILTYKY